MFALVVLLHARRSARIYLLLRQPPDSPPPARVWKGLIAQRLLWKPVAWSLRGPPAGGWPASRTCPFHIPHLLHHQLKPGDKQMLRDRSRAAESPAGTTLDGRLLLKKNFQGLLEVRVESCWCRERGALLRRSAGMQGELADCGTTASPLCSSGSEGVSVKVQSSGYPWITPSICPLKCFLTEQR